MGTEIVSQAANKEYNIHITPPPVPWVQRFVDRGIVLMSELLVSCGFDAVRLCWLRLSCSGYLRHSHLQGG